MKKEKITAVIVAAGYGLRMHANVSKQYLQLGDRQVLWYCLQTFDRSQVDSIVLVVAPEDVAYGKQLVREYEITKPCTVTAGGAERYLSVHAGLKAAADCDIVLIHDGARPFLTQDIIDRCVEGVHAYGACVAAVPAKDTVKLADEDGFVAETPRRDRVWQMQTPQAFSYGLIREAYDRLEREGSGGRVITDDAMVVEQFMHHPVRLVMGSYQNIKLTTPDDMVLAKAFLEFMVDSRGGEW